MASCEEHLVYCASLVGCVVGWPIKCRTMCMVDTNLHLPEWHSWHHDQQIISLFSLLLLPSSCCLGWLLCDWIHMVCNRFFFCQIHMTMWWMQTMCRNLCFLLESKKRTIPDILCSIVIANNINFIQLFDWWINGLWKECVIFVDLNNI